MKIINKKLQVLPILNYNIKNNELLQNIKNVRILYLFIIHIIT